MSESPQATSPPPSKTEPLPDWSTIDREILCPLCDYNLRGLIEPRCPECGHRTSWRELFEESAGHPFLFEYHPYRNVSSFFKTLNQTPFPGEFWEKVRPSQAVRTGRLLLYWVLICSPVLLLGITITSLQFGYQYGYLPSFFGQVWNIVSHPRALEGTVASTVLIAMAWPWLTLGALMVYRGTMRQARIRWQHVLRCVIYSGDVGLVAAIPLGIIVSGVYPVLQPVMWRMQIGLWPASVVLNPNIWFGALPLVLLMGYRLDVAYRKYLNFPDARRAVVASQIIVFLSMLKICFTFIGF